MLRSLKLQIVMRLFLIHKVIQDESLYVHNMYNSVLYLVLTLHPCEAGEGR
jgi:hypothetical protein